MTTTTCNEEVHVGDIGTDFDATFLSQCDPRTILDISAATTKEMIFKKPDGTKLTKAGTFVTDGSDGILRYTTISGDLDQAGWWEVEGHVITPGGEWTSTAYGFEVHANL